MAYAIESLSTYEKSGSSLLFTTKQMEFLKTLFSQSKVSKDLESTISNVAVSVEVNFTYPCYLIEILKMCGL